LVPSQGLKDRGVTKSHPGLVIAGKPLQQKMLGVLKTDSRARDAILGDRKKAVLGMPWSKNPNDVVVSADLTAASDLISHDLALALWEGAMSALSEQE
jgi:hypothetical protein